MNQFILPKTDLQATDKEIIAFVNMTKEQLKNRWHTKEGLSIFSEWKKSNYSRDRLDELVGRYYGNTDLRGIELGGVTLRDKDLNHIDFFSADLSAVDFSHSNLSHCWLSECNIKNTCFNWSIMDEVLIDSTEYNSSSSFHGIDLNKINFTLATLLKDLAEDQQRIATLEKTRPVSAFFLK